MGEAKGWHPRPSRGCSCSPCTDSRRTATKEDSLLDLVRALAHEVLDGSSNGQRMADKFIELDLRIRQGEPLPSAWTASHEREN